MSFLGFIFACDIMKIIVNYFKNCVSMVVYIFTASIICFAIKFSLLV